MTVTFTPTSMRRNLKGRVDATFAVCRDFDGESNTRPKGVVHVVAGGEATLYGPGLGKTAVTLGTEHGDSYADYTTKMVTDRHSFVLINADAEMLPRGRGTRGWCWWSTTPRSGRQ